jgi:murein L,D-transpeptidase YafK
LDRAIFKLWTHYGRAVVLGAATWLISPLLLAQAGSHPPIFVENALSFHMHQQDAENFRAGLVSIQQPMLPRGVLKLADHERFLLWVELSTGKLYVMEQTSRGGMAIRTIIPVSIGKNGHGKQREGDKRTPVGIYRFTSYLPASQLIDLYGNGAYPMSYPNALDRMTGRTGSGIWLHGLPRGIEERPFYDSDGCVVVDNHTLSMLNEFIEPGVTRIILSDQPLDWMPLDTGEAVASSLEKAFMDWRAAWAARDNLTYLSFYADDFTDLTRNKSNWDSYKKRVNSNKRFIEVDVSALSFLSEPNDDSLVTVRYYQDYRSNDLHWKGWKEQLWRFSEELGWQIVYEGNG